MKKILYVVLLAVVGLTMYSCDDYETYAEQRDYEISRISSFINNPTQGEIKGKKINVMLARLNDIKINAKVLAKVEVDA